MTRWMSWVVAGCCVCLIATANGCGHDLSGPKTQVETKSFNGGPIPPNSPWAKKIGNYQNAGNSVPKNIPAGAAANTPAPPKTF